MIDSKKRSLVKTAIFRSIIIIESTTISWIFTGDIETTAMISIVFNISSSVSYYLHERGWNKIIWGRITENKGLEI